jgi:hypothetical protein
MLDTLSVAILWGSTMFNKQLQISVQLDRGKSSFTPGNTLYATITLQAPRNTTLRRVTASLVYAWRYISKDSSKGFSSQVPSNFPVPSGTLLDLLVMPVAAALAIHSKLESDVPEPGSGLEILTSGEDVPCYEVLAENARLGAGIPQTFTCRLDLPLAAALTYSGKIIESKWYIRVAANVSMSRDATATIEVPVIAVPPKQRKQFGSQREEVAMFGGMKSMSLELPGLVYTEGDVIKGTLHAEATREVAVRAFQLQLWCVESVTTGSVPNVSPFMVKTLTLARQISMKPGNALTLPFEMPVDSVGVSSYAGTGMEVLWALKAVADTGWEARPTIAQKIYLHAGLHGK